VLGRIAALRTPGDCDTPTGWGNLRPFAGADNGHQSKYFPGLTPSAFLNMAMKADGLS